MSSSSSQPISPIVHKERNRKKGVRRRRVGWPLWWSHGGLAAAAAFNL
ncbi:hypothetical protein M8C21_028726 [Ambrosia artemisiifolia]|uniref:Uncharacterized protein n=1 Tax=Ambrosia artemisiifolia TaxID=4212 RepID=A0AAD5G797_AMBAR|nr:hypothetical protein M8C21_028726 [Ambrosia artemisiifolia]